MLWISGVFFVVFRARPRVGSLYVLLYLFTVAGEPLFMRVYEANYKFFPANYKFFPAFLTLTISFSLLKERI
jgi:hypothetical protein